MNNNILIESLLEFKELKNIDRPTFMSVLEDTFHTILSKKHGNVDIIINVDKGDIQVWKNRIIVNDLEFNDPSSQMRYSDALSIESDFEIGEDFSEEILLSSLDRRSILQAKQMISQKILQLNKERVYKNYKDRIGDIVSCEVYQIHKNEIILNDDEGNNIILPKSDIIPYEFFKKGDYTKGIIKNVEFNNNNIIIYLSRTDNRFLSKLMELEIPEIFDGLISIENIVREPGKHAKVSVKSYDDRVDPVGICIGSRGSRINNVVRELQNEKIDIINYTDNLSLYLTRSLKPTKISDIIIDEVNKKITIKCKSDQIGIAIGKGGYNLRLSSKLIGYEIELINQDITDEDVDLDEFVDEIDQSIINKLKI